MKNKEIREQLKKHNLCLWELADILEVSEPTVIRWMRHEMSDERKTEIITFIKEHSKEVD